MYKSFSITPAEEQECLEVLLQWFKFALNLPGLPATNAFNFFGVIKQAGANRSSLAELFLCLEVWDKAGVQPASSLIWRENLRHSEEKIIGSFLALEEICQNFTVPTKQYQPNAAEFLANISRESSRSYPSIRRKNCLACLPAVTDREFFVTQRGFLGVTNGHVAVGDLIVLAPALAAPTIIRQTANESSYRFVGIAEIDGLMPPWSQFRSHRILIDRPLWDDDELVDEKLTTYELL
jgi:hypothetical protein